MAGKLLSCPLPPSQAYFKFLQGKNKGLEFALEAKCFLGENGDFHSLQGGFCCWRRCL